MINYLISQDIKLLNFFRWLVNPDNLFLSNIVTFFSDFAVLLVAVLLVLIWLYWTYKKDNNYKNISLYIFWTIAISFVFYIIFNQFLPIRPRPETVSTIRPLINHLPDNSFPSWHAIFAGASMIWFFVFLRRKIIFYNIAFFSFLMLVCRIISWVHYPWDIIVWLILWIILWYLFFIISSRDNIKKFIDNFNLKIIHIVSYIKL